MSCSKRWRVACRLSPPMSAECAEFVIDRARRLVGSAPADAARVADALEPWLSAADRRRRRRHLQSAAGARPLLLARKRRSVCWTSTSTCCVGASDAAERPSCMKVAFETTTRATSRRRKRSSASITTSGTGCPCAWRRCRLPSATSGRGFRSSTGIRASPFRSSAMRALVSFLKDAMARAPRNRCAARLHAPGLSGRLRVSGRARSRAPRRATACGIWSGHWTTRDLHLRAAAQRAVEARLGRGQRRRPELLGSFLSFRPSMRAWDRPHARATGGASSGFARRRGRDQADRLVYPHVLRYAASRRVRLPQPVPGHHVRGIDGRLRRSAPRRRRFLSRHPLLGSRRRTERRDAAVSGLRRRYADVRFVPAEELFADEPTPTPWAEPGRGTLDPAYAKRYRAHDDEFFGQWTVPRIRSLAGRVARGSRRRSTSCDLGRGTGRISGR